MLRPPASHHSRLGPGEPDLAKIPRDAHPALGIVRTTDLKAPISFALSFVNHLFQLISHFVHLA
jgi:hypothetical protein